jgi:organic radical activating enzyme
MLEEPASDLPIALTATPPSTETLKFLWLELTGKCNLRCLHCYADSGPERQLHEYMTSQDWEDVLSQAASLGCRSVQFIGGEPTMYPALGMLIERARALGFERIEVYTNGTMFKPLLTEVFLRYKVDLAFSVYAAHAQTHDLVTNRIGSFDRTLAAIQWALASSLSVRVGIIEMDANAGQSEHTRGMLRAMGVKHIGIDRVRGVGRGAKDHSHASQFRELCGACARGRLAVTATGEIFPCVFSRFWPVGHATQGLSTVVEGVPLRTFQQEMRATQSSPRSQGGIADNRCPPGQPEPPDCLPHLCNPQDPDRPCVPDELERPCAPTGTPCGPDPCPPDEGPCQPDCTPINPPDPCPPNVG